MLRIRLRLAITTAPSWCGRAAGPHARPDEVFQRPGAPETDSVRVSATTTPPVGQTPKWKRIVKRSYESVTDNTYIFYATYFDANDDFIF